MISRPEQSHHDHTRRGINEELLRRADDLPPEDRLLLSAVYDRGLSLREVGRLTGRSHQQISRRMQRLCKRLRSPEFQCARGALQRFPPEDRPIIRAIFLHGHTQRETARECGVSLHHVRRVTKQIEGLVKMTRPGA